MEFFKYLMLTERSHHYMNIFDKKFDEIRFYYKFLKILNLFGTSVPLFKKLTGSNVTS